MLVLLLGSAALNAPLLRAQPHVARVSVRMETPEPAPEAAEEPADEAAPAPPPPPPPPPAAKPKAVTPALAAPLGSSKEFADIKSLAFDLNPVVGYWDPLNLCLLNFWNQGESSTIGFLRHAEIKHGRVAMAGFVGYIIHENGIHWPWPLDINDPTYSAFEGLSAPAVWDATSLAAKLQIIGFIGFLEIWSETQNVLESDGEKHYMRGGKPGYFPTFDLGMPKDDAILGWGVAHPVPFNLYDPLNFYKRMSEEEKQQKLLVEVNNGRLAMLGLMGFLSEAVTPGSVPGLKELVKAYDGNVMVPFAPGLATELLGA